MKIEFTITTPTETRTYTREYEPSTKEYMIADDAFMEAINYINSHNLTTLDDIDVAYKEVIDHS